MPTWEQICDDPHLRDLPFKIKQDKWGHIVMSPHKIYHGECQAELAKRLGQSLPHGVVLVECAVETDEGVKVPDVAASTRERRQPHRQAASFPVAPEICVEIASWSNTGDEMAEKRALYAKRGCVEFWTCPVEGALAFYDAVSGARLEKSACGPDFPARLQLD